MAERGTPRGCNLRGPGRTDEEFDMPKPIFPTHFGASGTHALCCWPDCSLATFDDLPICSKRATKAYLVVKDNLDFRNQLARERGAGHVEPKQGYVYFIRYRDRIKIGYSVDPRTRISQHPCDEVLAIVEGTMKDERRCHAAFADLRENGEWFRADGRLIDYAKSLGLAVGVAA